jgi:uncharacterized protein
MNKLVLSNIMIYPIKSMGGFSVHSAAVTDRGLAFDRRWMLVDMDGQFITQREHAQLALVQVAIENNQLVLTDQFSGLGSITIPFAAFGEKELDATIWNATCTAQLAAKYVNEWFTELLQKPCQLVFMPETTRRPVDTTSGYKPAGKLTSFADAYPFLLLGEAAVADLNTRLKQKVNISRFRPNLVFSGGTAYMEDEMKEFYINGVHFIGLENCARCSMITINQQTAEKTKEPMTVLATYRKVGNNVIFGRNVVHTGTGIVNVGDELIIQ